MTEAETFGRRMLRERFERRRADLERRRTVAADLGLDPGRVAALNRRHALIPEQQDLVDVVDASRFVGERLHVVCGLCDPGMRPKGKRGGNRAARKVILGKVIDTAELPEGVADPHPKDLAHPLGAVFQGFQFSPVRVAERMDPAAHGKVAVDGVRYLDTDPYFALLEHVTAYRLPARLPLTCGRHPGQEISVAVADLLRELVAVRRLSITNNNPIVRSMRCGVSR